MPTATHINYYKICHRKLWLFDRGIQMEDTSDVVYEGKVIGEYTYPQRADKYTQLAFEGIKIDFYDAKNNVVHEVKKSDKFEQAHIAQVQYYLYVLGQNDIPEAKGLPEYPKLRKTLAIAPLSEEDMLRIQHYLDEIKEILQKEHCPKRLDKPMCKSCSYYDLCYAVD